MTPRPYPPPAPEFPPRSGPQSALVSGGSRSVGGPAAGSIGGRSGRRGWGLALLLWLCASDAEAHAWTGGALEAALSASLETSLELAESWSAAAAERPARPSRAVLSEEQRRLLWRAGAGSVAGLSGARRQELAAERAAAISELIARLEAEPDEGASLRAELARDLAPTAGDAAWCAAARAVGAARVYDHAAALAAVLDDPSRPRRRLAAREGLRALYGSWFATSAEVQEYLVHVQDGPATRLLVEAALAADELAVQRELERLRILREDPTRFLTSPTFLEEERFLGVVDLLDADDPRLRKAAAELLADLARASEDDAVRTELWQRLAARVPLEVEPLVFERVVELLVEEVFTRAVLEERVEEVRRSLLTLAQRVEPDRALAVAEGLARLRWGAEQASTLTTELPVAMRSLGGLLERLLRNDDDVAPVEADVVLGTIRAAQLLLTDESVALQREDEGAKILRGALRSVLEGEIPAGDPEGEELALALRIAACAPYATLAGREDLQLLLERLGDPATPAPYAHALLGALAPRYAPTSPAAGQPPGEGVDAPTAADGLQFVERLAEVLARTDDADLQRRALTLLSGDALRPVVESALGQAPVGPDAAPTALGRLTQTLLAQLGDAGLAEDQRGIALELFGRVAGPGDLAAFLRLDVLDTIAKTGTKELGEVTALLQKVAADRPQQLLALARRLEQVDHPASKVSRARRALGLVAGLTSANAADLTPREHAEICRWALELGSFGVALDGLVADGPAFRERLVSVHVPGARAGTELARWQLEHLTALLQSSRVLGEVEGATGAQVSTAFQAALDALEAGAEAPPGATWSILRDRARWRAARGAPILALEDYSTLLQSAPDELKLADLRAALSALANVPTNETRTEEDVATDRERFLRTLVTRESWGLEPSAVRRNDLEAYLQAAETAPPSARADALRSLVETLSDLPAPDDEGNWSGGHPRWQAFQKDGALLTRLVDAHAAARAALDEPAGGAPSAAPADGDAADSSAPTAPQGAGDGDGPPKR